MQPWFHDYQLHFLDLLKKQNSMELRGALDLDERNFTSFFKLKIKALHETGAG